MVALLYCLTDVFFTVPWVGLQCVIVVFLDHTHFLFGYLSLSVANYVLWSDLADSYAVEMFATKMLMLSWQCTFTLTNACTGKCQSVTP